MIDSLHGGDHATMNQRESAVVDFVPSDVALAAEFFEQSLAFIYLDKTSNLVSINKL